MIVFHQVENAIQYVVENKPWYSRENLRTVKKEFQKASFSCKRRNDYVDALYKIVDNLLNNQFNRYNEP